MMVHRVGKTLLLDEFDINWHLLRTAETEWEWLRKFYYEHVLKSLEEKVKRKVVLRPILMYTVIQNLLTTFSHENVIVKNHFSKSQFSEFHDVITNILGYLLIALTDFNLYAILIPFLLLLNCCYQKILACGFY